MLINTRDKNFALHREKKSSGLKLIAMLMFSFSIWGWEGEYRTDGEGEADRKT